MKRLNVCDGQRQESQLDGHRHFILNLKAVYLWFVDVTHSFPTVKVENTHNTLSDESLKNLHTRLVYKTHTLWAFVFLNLVFRDPSHEDLWNIQT